MSARRVPCLDPEEASFLLDAEALTDREVVPLVGLRFEVVVPRADAGLFFDSGLGARAVAGRARLVAGEARVVAACRDRSMSALPGRGVPEALDGPDFLARVGEAAFFMALVLRLDGDFSMGVPCADNGACGAHSSPSHTRCGQ